jgi:hypothetical protein
MIKIVIWLNLIVASVCTFQVWILLILECCTCSEESIDYKIVIFGLTELKIWIKQVNRSVWFSLQKISVRTHKIWSFIVLLDSTFPKDSNEILFSIFGLINRKIWILQDWVEIWLEFSIWIGLIRNRATWRFLIGRYQFGWIGFVGRRILSGLGGWDLYVPVQLSDSISCVDVRSDG